MSIYIWPQVVYQIRALALRFSTYAALLFVLAGCTLDPITASQYGHTTVQPQRHITVQDISPATGPQGTLITITGEHFSSDLALNMVVFPPGNQAPIIEASSNILVVVVPPNTKTGQIVVQSGLWSDTSTTEWKALPPKLQEIGIDSFTPHLVQSGHLVNIYGRFPADTSQITVYFGHRKAILQTAATNQLTVTVPDSIQESSYIVVRTPAATAISATTYRAIVPGEYIAPRFCTISLSGAIIHYRDEIDCWENCPRNETFYPSDFWIIQDTFKLQSDTLWVPTVIVDVGVDAYLVVDNSQIPTLYVRKGAVVRFGEANIDDCIVQYAIQVALLKPIAVQAVAPGRYTINLKGGELSQYLDLMLYNSPGTWGNSPKCHCRCERTFLGYTLAPEATLSLDFWW